MSGDTKARSFWLGAIDLLVVGLVCATAVLGAFGIADGPVVVILGLTAAFLGFIAIARRTHTETSKKHRWPLFSVVLVVSASAVTAGLLLGPNTASNGVMRIAGGCEPFLVYGQNRYAPVNARILVAPYRESHQIGSLVANKIAYVDGWVRTESGNPSAGEPWNSNVWFHLVDDQGWVSFGGVRALPTSLDETGFDTYGGEPVPVLAECEAALR